jgi:hypothetical protein
VPQEPVVPKLIQEIVRINDVCKLFYILYSCLLLFNHNLLKTLTIMEFFAFQESKFPIIKLRKKKFKLCYLKENLKYEACFLLTTY